MGGARDIVARRLAALLLLLLAACTQTSGTVNGPVVSVEGDLETVTSFVVLVEGDEWRFLPVPDGDYAFPLQHLREHQRTGQPVLVGWETRDGTRYALSVEDG